MNQVHYVRCRKFNPRPYSNPKIPDFPPERLNDQPCFSGVLKNQYNQSILYFTDSIFFNGSVYDDNFSKCNIVICTCAATKERVAWWLATCARKPKVSGSSPAVSYVQR